MEVVASLSQGCTAAARCGLFTHKSVPVIFEPPYSICALDTHFFNSVLPWESCFLFVYLHFVAFPSLW